MSIKGINKHKFITFDETEYTRLKYDTQKPLLKQKNYWMCFHAECVIMFALLMCIKVFMFFMYAQNDFE